MPKRSRQAQSIAVLGFILSASSALAQGTILVGPSTRNGSFEDGVAAPWRDAAVANDPGFASDGSWYAVLQDTANGPTARAVPNQLFPPGSNPSVNPDNGLTFILTFDARNGVVGFDSVYGYVNAWNADGTPVLPSVTLLTSPVLGSDGWAGYETVFQLPGTWDGGGSFLVGIQSTKVGAAVGTKYTGYLDNVVLQQIPEPSALVLLGLGKAALLAVLMYWRFRSKA